MAADDQFGYSLRLVDGDLLLENDHLVTVVGKPNLLQALELRILTPLGSDIFNTTYGLDIRQAFTQSASVRMVKDLIKLNLVRTLGTDPRVRDIREVLFEDDPLYRERHPELDPRTIRDDRHRRFWQVEVVLDTVQGQTETLPVTIGV